MPSRSLPPARRLVIDMIELGRSIPHHHVERLFDFSALIEPRARSTPRVSWNVLLIKAFALAAQQVPQLRQSYLRWPWPRLYEHATSTLALAVQREDAEGERLFWGRIKDPACRTLAELQEAVDRFKNTPVHEVFRSQLRLARLPGPLRWLLWRLGYSFSGKLRAKEYGTFGLSTLAAQGVYNRTYPSILASNLTIGPLDEHGRGLVGLLYDHRIMDGVAAVRALRLIEKALHGPVALELENLSRLAAA